MDRTSRGKKRALLVVGCAVVLVAAACSKDTSSSTSSGTSMVGNVVFPSTTAAPGADPSAPTTSGPTIPDEARLPPGTEWPSAPDPCALVTEQAVRKITKFDMEMLNRPGRTPTGGPTKVCLYKNKSADVNGGSLTITILPPGTDIENDNSRLSDIESPGIGVKSLAGHLVNNPTGGKGLNIVAVDMGNGGFSIGTFIFHDIATEEIFELAREIAANWKVEAK